MLGQFQGWISTSSLLNDQKQHINSIAYLNDRGLNSIFNKKQYNGCLSGLRQLEHKIKLENYGISAVSRKCQQYHLFICYYNSALVYQVRNDNSKACQFLEKALNCFQRLPGFISSRQETVWYLLQLTRLYLQFCGLLSHCEEHQQASTLAEKGLDKLIQSARILQVVCYQQTIGGGLRETTCTSRQRAGRGQLIDFKSQLLQDAENILNILAKLSSPLKLFMQQKDGFKNLINKIIAWKQNGQNNQNMLKRQLKVNKVNSVRSLLGIQKSPNHGQFQIGSLMMLNWKNISYSPITDPLKLLSSNSLRQMAFLASVAYFTIATQTRFAHTDLSDLKNGMKIDQKYQRLHHDQRLFKCKVIHLKGLEIAGKLLPPNNELFSHLCQSFCRNYKFVLDEINQVSQLNESLVPKNILKKAKSGSNLRLQYISKSKTNFGKNTNKRQGIGRQSRSNSARNQKKNRQNSEQKERLIIRSISIKKKNI